MGIEGKRKNGKIAAEISKVVARGRRQDAGIHDTGGVAAGQTKE